jgi:hypothetical protein
VGVSCHVGDTSGFIEVSWSWHSSFVQMMTRLVTGTVVAAHWSWA